MFMYTQPISRRPIGYVCYVDPQQPRGRVYRQPVHDMVGDWLNHYHTQPSMRLPFIAVAAIALTLHCRHQINAILKVKAPCSYQLVTFKLVDAIRMLHSPI